MSRGFISDRAAKGPKVAALSGGVGGAKMLVGLDRATTDLTAIVNTGDDAVIYGVHVSPDIDIVTYWLAGVADTERGWGLKGDTFTVVEEMRRLGHDAWFRLGDRDFATCIHRTTALAAGRSLTQITDETRQTRAVRPHILPMTDDPVRTRFEIAGGGEMDFQDYFVRYRCEPEVTGVLLAGISDAVPGADVIASIDAAEIVIVCPSNPVVSTGPILALAGVREALRRHPRVVAVTPIVAGAPLKGPADRLLAATGSEVSASGVAALYADFCDLFVVDRKDGDQLEPIEKLGIRVAALDTIMSTTRASERLANEILTIMAQT